MRPDWAGLFCGVLAGDPAGGVAEVIDECGGFDDAGIGTPAEDPASDFDEGAEEKADFDTAVGEVDEFLGGMPAFLLDVGGDLGAELDDDLEVT